MVPSKPPSGGRALLPVEVALCETVGITAEEYLYFQQLSDAYNGKRDEVYDLVGVPDIKNEPSLIISIVSLVIGIASSAISMLLAPKPKESKTPGSVRTADIAGARRFTEGENFDSIQELARLGSTIPLVFAHRDRTGTGGIRVDATLVWSQLLSRGTGQQLKALMVLSMGKLRSAPDFAGYAVGDSSLKNYSDAKVALYFRQNGGRILESNRSGGTLATSPSSDVFQVYDDLSGTYQPWFSGTRTPSTQTQFGLHSPMGNGVAYKIQYELVMFPKGVSSQTTLDNITKSNKLGRKYETFQAFYGNTNVRRNVNEILNYYCEGVEHDAELYQPWGLDDVNAALEDRRIEADTNITVGDMYMAGSAVVVCIDQTQGVWVPGKRKNYNFRVIEAGDLRIGSDTSVHNPYEDHLQRIAIGTISNNRACDATEIGIKSTVWRQINFPNVNSIPSNQTLNQYNQDSTSLQLGNVDRYITRYSFFRLQYRKLGVASTTWNDLSAGGIPFAIKGNSPTAQYNFIRIRHPERAQYEFRMMPVSGAEVFYNWQNKIVRLIEPTDTPLAFQQDGFSVRTTGTLLVMSYDAASNSDFIINTTNNTTGTATARGPITALNSYKNNNQKSYAWLNAQDRYNNYNNQVYRYGNAWEYYWDGQKQGERVYTNGPATNNGIQQILGSIRYRTGSVVEGSAFTTDARYRIIRETLQYNNFSQTRTVALIGGKGQNASLTVNIWTPNDENTVAAEWTINQGGSGYENNDTLYADVAGVGRITVVVTITPQVQVAPTLQITGNLNPFDAIADYKLYDSEKMSHERGPEHEVVYVNELLAQGNVPEYDNMAMVGVRLNSTKEWSSFQQLSAYVRNGIEVERLCDNQGNPVGLGNLDATQNLPEIAYTLLTDKTIGAGNIVGAPAVDRERMQIAAKFCYANQFNWDGVISEKLNLREWIYEMAGYCLLDFTILGGRFSLVPSVPYNSNGTINYQGAPEIKALFTDGNIRNLKVTWLSPEERQLFKAVIKVREEIDNGFTRDRTITVRLADALGGSELDPEESFDMSAWCSSTTHAETFAKYALKLRKLVDHGLTFETTPAGALGLAPGEYIRLVSEVTHTSRFNNGSIDSSGTITSTTTLADGFYPILYWEPGTVGVKEATLSVVDGVEQSGLHGVVFTLKNSTTTSRVYKVESITIGEEGFVQIACSYQPVNTSNQLEVLQWSPGDFVVEAF